jgi:hypothetical protein
MRETVSLKHHRIFYRLAELATQAVSEISDITATRRMIANPDKQHIPLLRRASLGMTDLWRQN